MQRINISEFLQPQSSRQALPPGPKPFRGSSYNYVVGFAVTDLLADLFAKLRRVIEGGVELRRADELRENKARATEGYSCILDPIVRKVCYDTASDSVKINMSNGVVATIPCRSIRAIDREIRKRLGRTRLSASRTAIIVDQLDVECDIEVLLRQVFGLAEERLRGHTRGFGDHSYDEPKPTATA